MTLPSVPLTVRRRGALAAGTVALAAASVLAATGPVVATGSGAAVSTGRMTPAVGVHPHYRHLGRATKADAVFTCQLTTPAGCYAPAQIRAAYGIDTLAGRGLTGAGTSITIIDAYQSPTIRQDLASFNTLFGLPTSTLNVVAPDGLTPFDPKNEEQVGWAGEISLDVEWAHAVAPGATINLVLARTSDDADINSALRYVVQHDLGDVVSQSYGENESCVGRSISSAQSALFAQAVKQGQTLFASSGDQGDAQLDCAGKTYVKAVSSPAVDPNVTAVGGTVLDADGRTGAYHGETTWNEPAYPAGSGGGYSVTVPTPAFQQRLRLPSRGVPDVAYNASIDSSVLVVSSSLGDGPEALYGVGGTSSGSPQWAGLAALAVQSGRHRLGQINSALYLTQRLPGAYARSWHDVTTGTNSYDSIAGYSAGTGWDATTGLGSPRADVLVPYLAAATRN